MRWVRGFDKQILEALESNNEDIHYQAVRAAGNWEMDAAWPHISGLVSAPGSDKPLLLAAVDAMATIRPQEASATLLELAGSDDEEIVDAAHEAMALAAALSDDAFDDV
jgi:HEAT repeat protein